MQGVERVIVGYAGGKEPNPTYYKMKDHTESVMIEYDPKEVSYWQILEMWHDNDYPWKREPRQYRSAIFWTSLAQQDQALQFVDHLRCHSNNNNPKKQRLYTDVEFITKFYQAESHHQDYHARRQIQTAPKKKQ